MTINAADQIPERIYQVLDDVGIRQNIKGYKYMAYAINLVAEDPEKINSITKVLYPEVAKEFNTTASRVERALRHAIEIAFLHTEWKVIIKYFGNSVDAQKGKPTNSQFIATIGSLVRRQIISSESQV